MPLTILLIRSIINAPRCCHSFYLISSPCFWRLWHGGLSKIRVPCLDRWVWSKIGITIIFNHRHLWSRARRYNLQAWIYLTLLSKPCSLHLRARRPRSCDKDKLHNESSTGFDSEANWWTMFWAQWRYPIIVSIVLLNSPFQMSHVLPRFGGITIHKKWQGLPLNCAPDQIKISRSNLIQVGPNFGTRHILDLSHACIWCAKQREDPL